MVKFTLKIFIGKKNDIIFVNEHNISFSCYKLLKAYEKNQLIKCPINWKRLNKDIINLINMIANYLILETSQNIDKLLIDKTSYTLCQIHNLEFFMHIIFCNKLIIKCWMKDPSKWKSLFILFKIILNHKHLMNRKFLSLALLISQTQLYWNVQHLIFLMRIDFHISLCIAIKRANYKLNEWPIRMIILSISHNYSAISCRDDGVENKKKNLYKIFKRRMDHCLTIQIPQADIRQKFSKYQRHHYMMYYHNYVSFVCKYRTLDFSNAKKVRLTIPVKSFKACSYFNCNKIKTKKNKIKMKICKGCKLTYYCSRKCQKRDWVLKHRKICQRIYKQMSAN